MENQLFTWDGWDDAGVSDVQFYDVTLIVPVGEFPIGTKFPTAFWMGSQSLLSLIDSEEKEHLYEIKAFVGEKIDPATLHKHSENCGCNP
jgi:hypothetical protein